MTSPLNKIAWFTQRNGKSRGSHAPAQNTTKIFLRTSLSQRMLRIIESAMTWGTEILQRQNTTMRSFKLISKTVWYGFVVLQAGSFRLLFQYCQNMGHSVKTFANPVILSLPLFSVTKYAMNLRFPGWIWCVVGFWFLKKIFLEPLITINVKKSGFSQSHIFSH